MNEAEYLADKEWLRSHPHGFQAQVVKRRLREWERELAGQGTSVEAWLESDRTRLGFSPWYVGFFHNRPGQPLASKVRHADRQCQHLSQIGDEEVREATEAELERLPPCGTCG